jgi:UDP-N-acetyl-D-mannosaminuronic acid dehydrogenase
VGLPLAISFASKGLSVLVLDFDREACETIRQGTMPFLEHGAEPLLREALGKGNLSCSDEPSDLEGIRRIIVTIGTPIDEFLNPVYKVFGQFLDTYARHMSSGQLVVLRSTVYPGTTDWLRGEFHRRGLDVKLAFCPERIVQGYALQEIPELPQIISGTSEEAAKEAADLFLHIAKKVVYLSPVEAEFGKLFCNAYRYVRFAVTNQFYMIADSLGLDYHRILDACKRDYPRLQDMPGAGLAAGPCLFKDTMMLAARARNQFSLGPVGLLGMAFKADSDDTRASLSYKLKKALDHRARQVLTTDPLVKNDDDLLPLEAVIQRSDVLVLCAPHKQYKNLNCRGKPVIDVWGFNRRP